MERAFMIFRDISFIIFVLFIIITQNSIELDSMMIVLILIGGLGYCFMGHFNYYKKTKKYF
ncbi:hypothetical protein A5893_13405 [Pedobacter psychrophilus]|uniref:Uncharacterized protein n=1 Tax=Pedobacter psychrophilus TaxID=1826909 RepID=A0A179DCB0_9SPHI|nr:hypothetical protein A5893_13405 [Pedobacter psychrophilus]